MITPELAQAISREREREAQELARLAELLGGRKHSRRKPGGASMLARVPRARPRAAEAGTTMAQGVRTITYTVADIAQAKSLFSRRRS
jgi:hypothetical protein